MSDGQQNSQLTPQIQQSLEQRNGIGSARHGGQDAVSRLQQSSFANVAEHLLAHATMLRPGAFASVQREYWARRSNRASSQPSREHTSMAEMLS